MTERKTAAELQKSPGMHSSRFLQKLVFSVDELACRLSVRRIEFFTMLGRVILPLGYWGNAGHPENGQPHVYLTFDDGPNPQSTPRLLKLLEQNDIKATFFLIGLNCLKHPELVRAIHEAGHVIGNHSYSHPLLPMLSSSLLEQQIIRTNEIIEEITGLAPTIFRPPFGILDERAGRVLKKLDMTPVYWGSAPEDWLVPGSHRVIRRVMWKIADGTLIVLHEGEYLGDQTIEAAKEIIYRCKTLGYQFSKVNVRAGLQATGR